MSSVSLISKTILVAVTAIVVFGAREIDLPAATVPVGVAKVEVTPPLPIRLAGYASRNKESQKVIQKLWAKALAIGSDEQQPVVLVTIDSLNVPEDVIEEVARSLHQKSGIERARFALCVTHTHSAPALGNRSANATSDIPPNHQERIDAYTVQIRGWLEEVAVAALADRRPARLAWGKGKATFALNRRAIKNGKWAGFGGNPHGPVDNDLPLLAVTDPQGKLRAVWVSYACHGTTIGQNDPRFYDVHGDWLGAAQEQIEAAHPGAIALLAAGCAADINPANRGTVEAAEQNGKAVADGVGRLLQTDLHPLNDVPQCRLERFSLPLDPLPSLEELKRQSQTRGWAATFARTLLERLDRGEKPRTELPYSVQTWVFDNRLAIVFLPGEVVVDYALRLKHELDPQRLWITAYANGVPGYIVSKRLLPEGGYEVDSSRRFYNLPTRLAPETEDLIINKTHALLPAGFRTK